MRLRISGKIVYVPKTAVLLFAVLLTAGLAAAGVLMRQKSVLPEVERGYSGESGTAEAVTESGIGAVSAGQEVNSGEKSGDPADAEPSSPASDSAGNGIFAGPGDAARHEGLYAVHISGAVAVPGVYWLLPGSIVQDAVDMAGGLTEDADTYTVNLAMRIADGMRLNIPARGENGAEWLLSAGNSGENGSSGAENGLLIVNINTASASELTKLSGIGDSTAMDIIAYREEHGKFASIEEIMSVPGIKEAKFNKIKKFITV